MLIKDVMTPNPVTVNFDAQVRDVARLLKKYRIGGLPVMDGERVIGIVTETDVISLLDTSESNDDLCLPLPLDAIEFSITENVNLEKTRKTLIDIGNTPVTDIMTQEVVIIEDDASVQEGANIMSIEDIARLPVIRDDRLVGIVTRRDIVRGIGLSGANFD